MFDAEQRALLKAKLDGGSVRERSQAGRKFSYIEGWHAIAEANRIFGFDRWNRETVDIRQLGEPREVDGKWRVAYFAKVRVTVFAGGADTVVREGCGYGSGIDRDPGSAHESALKESETDAMKRALMTFGNPFGLALYDKDQAEVDHSGNGHAPPPAPVSDAERDRAKEAAETIRTEIKTANTLDKLQSRMKEHGPTLARIKAVSPPAYDTLMQFAELRRRTMAEAA